MHPLELPGEAPRRVAALPCRRLVGLAPRTRHVYRPGDGEGYWRILGDVVSIPAYKEPLTAKMLTNSCREPDIAERGARGLRAFVRVYREIPAARFAPPDAYLTPGGLMKSLEVSCESEAARHD